MDEPRLLHADSFVVTRPPGVFGRTVLKLAGRTPGDPRCWIRDDAGQPIGAVVPVTKRLRKAIDGYIRHDVVDPEGGRLLALRQLPSTMFVQDAGGTEIGCAHLDRRAGPVFHSGPGSMAGRGPVIGHVTPMTFGRYELVLGEMTVTDPDGGTVATVTNTDGYNNVVRMSPGVDGPLRLLTIAFACSLVQHIWVHLPRPND